MRSTFNILFYINRNKIKKNGKCPIMGRITVDGKQTQFSLKEDTDPSLWSVDKGCSTGKDKTSKELNLKLEQYRNDLKSLYNKLVEDEVYITAESLKNALLNTSNKEVMLLEEFKAHNAEYYKGIGVTKSRTTYYCYEHAYKSLKKFLSQKYGLEDIAFKQLHYSFIEDFEFFLSVNLKFAPNTVFNVIMKLKRIVHRAINKEIIRKNPFADFRIKPVETNRKWLSKNELDKIMQTPMKDKNTEFTRIMFIFATFTGLAFADLYNLKHKHISTDSNGITWIRIKRRKTGTESIIPLLAIPLRIILKYGNSAKENKSNSKVFNMPYYAQIRFCLNEIKTITNLKSLKFHTARHCYATQICLSNGVPIESLSRMLGHKNINTTQIYAKVTNRKIDEDMQALEKRLGDTYQLKSPSYINPIIQPRI